jgi:hypothetical protein
MGLAPERVVGKDEHDLKHFYPSMNMAFYATILKGLKKSDLFLA